MSLEIKESSYLSDWRHLHFFHFNSVNSTISCISCGSLNFSGTSSDMKRCFHSGYHKNHFNPGAASFLIIVYDMGLLLYIITHVLTSFSFMKFGLSSVISQIPSDDFVGVSMLIQIYNKKILLFLSSNYFLLTIYVFKLFCSDLNFVSDIIIFFSFDSCRSDDKIFV